MLIQQFQKGHRAGVKWRKTCLFCLLVAISLPCFSQSLLGTYVRQRSALSGTRQIAFNNGKFSEKISSEEGETYGEGTYVLDSNRLILNYKGLPDTNASTYLIKAEKETKTDGLIDFKIFTNDTTPTTASISIINKQGSPIASFFTDKSGYLRALIYEDAYVGFVAINKVGYDRVMIPIQELISTVSTVTVNLRPQNGIFYIKPQRIKHEIMQKGNTLILDPKSTLEEILKRVD